jgi:hypothetical protein
MKAPIVVVCCGKNGCCQCSCHNVESAACAGRLTSIAPHSEIAQNGESSQPQTIPAAASSRPSSPPLDSQPTSICTSIMDQQAISKLIFDAVKAQDEKAMAEAAKTISAQATASASEINDFVWDVFNAVFDVSARTVEDKQSALVKFMEKLREIEVPDASGQPLTVEGGKIWTDMPTFGWVARDLWNFGMLPFSIIRAWLIFPIRHTGWNIG